MPMWRELLFRRRGEGGGGASRLCNALKVSFMGTAITYRFTWLLATPCIAVEDFPGGSRVLRGILGYRELRFTGKLPIGDRILIQRVVGKIERVLLLATIYIKGCSVTRKLKKIWDLVEAELVTIFSDWSWISFVVETCSLGKSTLWYYICYIKVFVFNYVTSRKGLIETVRYSNLPKQFYSNLLTLIS